MSMLTLRQWRRIKEISQESMAERLGISPSTYNSWEKNPEKISIANGKKIAEIFNEPIGDIFFSNTL